MRTVGNVSALVLGAGAAIMGMLVAPIDASSHGPTERPPVDLATARIPTVFDPTTVGKALVMTLDFASREEATASSVEVVGGAAPKPSEVPGLGMTVKDHHANVLGEFRAWHPLWDHFSDHADAHGGDLRIRNSGTGTLTLPFWRDAHEVVLTDMALDREVGVVNLDGAIASYCASNPSDRDCLETDLNLDLEPSALPVQLLLGTSEAFHLTVTSQNLGPDDSTESNVRLRATTSSPGLLVEPSETEETGAGLLSEGSRTTAWPFTLSCIGPGVHQVSFSGEISTVHPAEVDRELGNNREDVQVDVDCVTPITINVMPGSRTNPIQTGRAGTVPVALLTTAAGEYELPIAFDAATVDLATLRFGPPGATAGGASESHQKEHPDDALELDETTHDGDTDLLAHFDVEETRFRPGDERGCVSGRYLSSDGISFLAFYGCDRVSAR